MFRFGSFLLVAMLGACVASAAQAAQPQDLEWRFYGHDAHGTKYSTANQIDAGNVQNLRVAWRWQNPDDALGKEVRQRVGHFKATPLMVNGVLYTSTGLSQAAAVDAETGETLWVYNPEAYKLGRPANTGWQHRGLAYWQDSAGDDRRVVYATGTGRLIALNVDTGKPIQAFGEQGQVDLQAGIIETDDDRQHIGYNSAPIVVRDTIVLGCTVMDRPDTVAFPKCPVRGFDVRTGALKWTFSTVAQGDDPASKTWEDESWRHSGAANAWTTFSADPELGYVYVPTGTPHNDYYGGHRKGDNRYAESLLCLEAETGKLVWDFQAVHHGLWDYDFPAAPTLVDIEVDGNEIAAVALVSKQGFTYVFDRVTGEPVWPIVEKPVPQSKVPGEQTAATQPYPTKPPPFVQQGITEDDLIDFTPELRAAALEIVEDFKLGELFMPPIVVGEDGRKTVVQVPGAAGGANWGGSGVDPETGYLFLQAANLPTPASVAPGKEGQADYLVDFSAIPMGPEGLPLVKPPYGTVTAIDLNAGTIAWQVPHGQGPTDHPAIKHLNLDPLGAHSVSFLTSGGPLVTRTLLFVNQAQSGGVGFSLSPTERFLRAFNKDTGAVVWEERMTLAPMGTPMTYVYKGRQYIVVAAGGAGEPAELVAYALPE
jgi:quinoprotein glucose dehydrogenase